MTTSERAVEQFSGSASYTISTFTHRGVRIDQVETKYVVGWSLHPFMAMEVSGVKNLVVWDSKRNREQALAEIEALFDQTYVDLLH